MTEQIKADWEDFLFANPHLANCVQDQFMKQNKKADVAPAECGQHTPTPWHVEKVKHEWEGGTYSANRADYYSWSVFDEHMTLICETPRFAVSRTDCAERKANAELIARSGNQHQTLVAALAHLLELVDECAINHVPPSLHDGDWPIAQARAALAGVREK